MKKHNRKIKKKKSSKKKSSHQNKNGVVVSEAADLNVDLKKKKASKQKPARSIQKKTAEIKSGGDSSVQKIFSKTSQFLREAKTELKKVKWPTRKELLASTAVVIILTLLIAAFLGLVDFGLIKIIKGVVG